MTIQGPQYLNKNMHSFINEGHPKSVMSYTALYKNSHVMLKHSNFAYNKAMLCHRSGMNTFLNCLPIHHWEPCRLASAIMDLHLSRSQTQPSRTFGLSLCGKVKRLFRIVCLYLPVLLFPSIFPVVTKCCICFRLLQCPMKFYPSFPDVTL